MFIRNQRPSFIMRGTHFQFPLKVLKCLMIAITIIITGIFVSSLILNQNHTAVAQQSLVPGVMK
jgi:hypothetical protein